MKIKNKAITKKPTFNLDAYEQSIEDSLDDDSFTSVYKVKEKIAIAKKAAVNHLNKDNHIKKCL